MNNKDKTILVVEDDNDTRMAICTMLENLGYNPVAYGSPTEAANALPKIDFALALLDIMMPEMDGYELLKRIKEVPKHKDIPVIMVTAKDKDGEVLEGYQYGADYYITKPFTTKQLEYGIKIFLS